jgi:hypothetical protein
VGPGVQLNLPAGIEVGVESVSGFSRWVRVRYDFGNRVQRHRLCGSGGHDESVAGRILSGRGAGGHSTLSRPLTRPVFTQPL